MPIAKLDAHIAVLAPLRSWQASKIPLLISMWYVHMRLGPREPQVAPSPGDQHHDEFRPSEYRVASQQGHDGSEGPVPHLHLGGEGGWMEQPSPHDSRESYRGPLSPGDFGADADYESVPVGVRRPPSALQIACHLVNIIRTTACRRVGAAAETSAIEAMACGSTKKECAEEYPMGFSEHAENV
eukprot:scaffold212949_cov42-Prasinocladus_malaysianus.AAC.1